MKKNNILIIGIFVILILLMEFIPGLNYNYIKTSKLYINEIMASNSYTILDEDEEYSDYIELYNNYNYAINLNGYHLSDSEFETDKWTFPDIEIKAKSYLVIYASGKDKCDKECHTNFKLSSHGEIITLTDNMGNIISKVTYGEIDSDVSYGYYKGKYIYTNKPTPNKENDGTSFEKNNTNYKISINEYMTHNTRYNYDSEGYYYDWIELYNESNDDIEISGLYLSDDINNLKKYMIPSVKVKGNDYLLIYLSDDRKIINNEVYANFKLSDDEEIILSNGNRILDRLKTVKLLDNISYGKVDKEWYYFTKPTPNSKNNTAYFKKLGDMNGNT